MAFDLMKTVNLIKGGLLDAEETWKKYLDSNPTWQETAIQLTGPVIIANVLLSLVFARIVGGYIHFGYGQNIFAALVSGLVFAAIGFTVAVAVFSGMAGVFKGKASFSRAFAAVSLAAIPAWVGGILGSVIPFLGGLIALAGMIMSLVYLYKIMPIALSVPDDKRVIHFIVSLVCIMFVNMILATVLGIGSINRNISTTDFSRNGDTPVYGSGIMGDLERQGKLLAAAQADEYDPPSDGKLSDDQVETFVAVLRKKKAMAEVYAAQMKDLGEELEEKKEAGTLTASDLAKASSSFGSAMAINNIELEIVKTAGENWAEHLWVREQLRTAFVQQGEGSDAFEHNFRLYQEFEDELEDLY